MRLVQSVRSGELRFEEDTIPTPGPTQVLVATRASLISAGTERSLHSLASASLLAKARARPDLVREVIDRARSSGIRSTFRVVRSRLADDMPLGYSAAGVVTAVGEAVADIRPGLRVATAGAPHADHQIVAGNLTVPLPHTVSFEEGAFSTVASIALNGLRLAEAGAGSRILVVGLGLMGQVAARVAAASGAVVGGIDPIGRRRAIAQNQGVSVFGADDEGWEAALQWTGGTGADAVLITAATESSQPVLKSAEMARDRAVIVLVGEVGMELDRRPFYDRELTLRVARSYGPGRYDPSYEDLGIDYPPGHVRWTARRNMEAFLGLVERGNVEIADLITHRFPFGEALAAYELLGTGDSSQLGIVFEYDEKLPDRTSPRNDPIPASVLDSALIGTGMFARNVLVPAATSAGFSFTRYHSTTGSRPRIRALATAAAAADPDEALEAVDTPVVFIATRHDSHASLVTRALDAGKHVFCEKPLALGESELASIEASLDAAPGVLMVGFNRRWAPAILDATDALGPGGPVQIIYRINAGVLREGHWLGDRRNGGRLLGEACHFVDTCSAVVGVGPATVMTLTSGRGELLLDEDFTLLIGYPDGSQATITYAAHSSTRPGKERIEILGRNRSILIDNFHHLEVYGPDGRHSKRYRGLNKGHRHELEIFAGLVSGEGDAAAVSTSALETTRAMFAAMESAMSGGVARLRI